MEKAVTLKPQDVVVLLQRASKPGEPYRELATAVGLSVGEAHNATKRLMAARLLVAEGETVNLSGALQFLSAGVPYAFPGVLGPETRGVPTAHSAPPLSTEIESQDKVVWPSLHGEMRGNRLIPLSPYAPETLHANPDLYRLLTLVDALRIGRARERKLATRYLEEAFLGFHTAQ